MATVKSAYSSATTITCTLTSLAATAGRESASIDNSSNLYLDALVQVTTKMGGTTPANDKALYIYVAGSDDAGTTWPDVVTGSDAAITVQSPTQLRLLGTIFTGGSTATVLKSEPMSVASLFGGQLPPRWSVVFVNSSSVLDATGGSHVVQYVGVTQTIA